ncbi:MAG: L-threonylcarbamoyladenylate synthase [Pirellulales bacterium]
MEHALPDTVPVPWPDPSAEPPEATRAALERAVAVLAAGGLVAIPTETVYGLAAVAVDPAAVGRIFTAKGRQSTNPLIVHVADTAMAKSLAAEWPPVAERITARFWPGPVTVVVPRGPRVPEIVTAGGETVALRCPAHPLVRRLIAMLGAPLAAPSANRSLRLSPTTAGHVYESLGARVDLILDGGPCAAGIESTVIDCTATDPVILRPGPVTVDDLGRLLGRPVESAVDWGTGPARSPGRLRRHYAPRTPLEVTDDAPRRVRQLTRSGRRIGWLCLDPDAPATRAIAGSTDAVVVPMPADPRAYGSRLYATLHALDRRSLDVIVVDAPPEAPGWDAIRDRLERASATAGEDDTAGDDAGGGAAAAE